MSEEQISILLIAAEPLPELQAALMAENFAVVYVDAVSAAVKLLPAEQSSFDGVLLSLNLPDANPTEFLEWLKITHPQIAALVIGEQIDEQILIACLNKGASDFCELSMPLIDLLSTLKLALRKQKSFTESVGGIHAKMPVADWVELVAQTETEYFGRVQRFSEALFRHRLATSVVDDLRMALEELGRNAIEWGNRYDRNKKFSIRYAFIGEELIIVIEDEGEGFDWGASMEYDPSKDPLGHLKTRKANGKRPGGFGIFMMKKIMDDIFYNAKGNICVMKKNVKQKNNYGN